MALRFAIGNTVWTRALFDGSVKVDGFDVELPDPVPLEDHLYGVRRGDFAAGDPTFTDCVLDRANGTDGEQTILVPVYLISGFRHRTLITRRNGPAVEDLTGRTLCMPRVLTPGGVWMRGLLQDEFGIQRTQVKWVTVHSADNDADWPYVERRLNYPEGLAGIRAAVGMVSKGELDGLFHPGAHDAYSMFGGDPMIGPVLQEYPDLWSPLGDPDRLVDYFRRTGIYHFVHALAINESVARAHAGLVDAIVTAFAAAREKAPNYMSTEQRSFHDRERTLLGCDPTAPELGALQRRSLETLIRYLDEDGLIRQRPTLDELFPFHSTGAAG